MAEDEAKDETIEEDEEEESGGGSKLLVILTVVNVLISLGTAGFIYISFQKQQTHPRVEDIAESGSHGSEHGGGGSEHGGDDGQGKPEGNAHGESADGHGAAKKQEQDFGKMIALEQFTVNLSTAGSVAPKFARVNISLEVDTDDTEGEVGQKMPNVRNTIIDLFNSKRPADLSTPEGRSYLRDEIKNAVNSFLVTGQIRGVYFTSFALSS